MSQLVVKRGRIYVCVAVICCVYLFLIKYINARHPFLIFYDAEGNKKEEIGYVRHAYVSPMSFVSMLLYFTVSRGEWFLY